ncbi:glycogen/starch/alpha-glucan phosphorylase [Francisella tularensis]|nr:glycogen/starch/alpha-glucan phosphorylase [Francisella tularensis]
MHNNFSGNGITALNTDILKISELNHFNNIYPNKFNNNTNDSTIRRL